MVISHQRAGRSARPVAWVPFRVRFWHWASSWCETPECWCSVEAPRCCRPWVSPGQRSRIALWKLRLLPKEGPWVVRFRPSHWWRHAPGRSSQGTPGTDSPATCLETRWSATSSGAQCWWCESVVCTSFPSRAGSSTKGGSRPGTRHGVDGSGKATQSRGGCQLEPLYSGTVVELGSIEASWGGSVSLLARGPGPDGASTAPYTTCAQEGGVTILPWLLLWGPFGARKDSKTNTAAFPLSRASSGSPSPYQILPAGCRSQGTSPSTRLSGGLPFGQGRGGH